MYLVLTGLALLLGILLVTPIGGADMPVVISLLNSYSGLAASAAGFVLGNMILIISGALVGAAGLILTNLRCKAMTGPWPTSPSAPSARPTPPGQDHSRRGEDRTGRGRGTGGHGARVRSVGDRRPGYGLAVARRSTTSASFRTCFRNAASA